MEPIPRKASGPDVRLCLKGTTWPYNAYQDGLELAVRITGTFALGSALYTQSPGIDLQACLPGGVRAETMPARDLYFCS